MVNCFHDYANHYKTNHILFTLGADFAYQFADVTYEYIEDMVEAVKGSSKSVNLKFIYSTV